MECKTWKTIDVNGDRMLIMGEGIQFHIRDDLWDREAMRVHMERYHPIGRMFADRYCRTDDRVVFPPAEGAKRPEPNTEMGREQRFPRQRRASSV